MGSTPDYREIKKKKKKKKKKTVKNERGIRGLGFSIPQFGFIFFPQTVPPLLSSSTIHPSRCTVSLSLSLSLRCLLSWTE
ncbi:hypothetical protein Syun_002049 [Stephania yunnanensis]|uniref:Uncharacterized protein n=1 Tax=Stephania yunnanensis TaxID=152371 RepID=A0AAP0LKR6_9MAGN